MGVNRRKVIIALLAALLLGGCAAAKASRVEVNPAVTEPTVTAVTETAEAFPADWYGWWRMTDTSGDWAHMYGYWWDCCARVSDEGDLSMELWDENPFYDGRLGRAVLCRTEQGLRCLSGEFLDRTLRADEWTVSLDEDELGPVLTIRGDYAAVNSTGAFHYEITLRPWGSLWPEDTDKQPYYYTDWYLPLIEAGRPMPDDLGGAEGGNGT